MINFRDRYLEALGTQDKNKLEHAHGLANEIRKFEIELYWKRATYFWAFQLIAFTALGFLLKDREIKPLGLLLIPASLGVITALAGVLTARGSKFWQENWEAHVDLLEDETEVRLTQVVMCCRRSPQFSVSRINESLMWLLFLGWGVALVVGAFPQAQAEEVRGWFSSSWRGGIGVFIMVVVACVWMSCRNTTDFTGYMYRLGDTNWMEYTSKRKSTIPFIIWRDPQAGRRARRPGASPEATT